MMVVNGISYTKKEKVVDLGPLEVNKNETKRVNWPMYAGVVVTLAGVIVTVAASRKKS